MSAVYIPSEPSSFKGGKVDLSGGYESSVTFIFSTLLVVLLLVALGRLFVSLYYYFYRSDDKTSQRLGRSGFSMVAQTILFGLLMVGVVTSIDASFGKNIMFTQLPSSSTAGAPGVPNTPPTTTTPPDLEVPPPTNTTVSANFNLIMQTEQAVRAKLASGNIQVIGTKTNEPCSTYGQKGCTTVGGLSEKTISMLFELKQSCNCTLQVVGGTEYWSHNFEGPNGTRHMPGAGAVDLQPNGTLDSFISASNGFSAATPWSICTGGAFSWKGFYFCRESSHWHVQ